MSRQLVRYKSGKKVFEVATKPGAVRKYRDGKLGWDKVLHADAVFINFKKGNVAKASDLQSVFGTSDEMAAAKIIVEQGDAQVSAAERKQDFESHRRAVIAYLHKNYLDSRPSPSDAENKKICRPHPISRLEGVVEESKVRLDASESVEKQAEAIIKKMQGKLVFVKSTMECTLFLEHKYAKKCTGTIYKNCDIVKEEWDAQGCKWVLNVSPGDFDSFCNELNKTTGGDYLLAMGQKDPRENRPVEEDLSKKKPRKRDKRKGRRK